MFDLALETIDDTPALVVDWEVVERNLDRMAALAADRQVRLRPHMKTHKMGRLAIQQVGRGAVGLTVAKLGEATTMVRFGIHDLLVAYPVVGKAHVRRLLDLCSQAEISVALDSWEVAEPIAREAARRSMEVGVLVEVDTGMHRCGVAPGSAAAELARRVSDTKGLVFRGLMTHEGHAYAAGSAADMQAVTVAAGKDMKRTTDALLEVALKPEVVSMGSSGTARFGIGLEGVNEFRPGTYVFNDLTQVSLGACELQDCAAAVLATVVSRSQRDEAVIDAGSKTLSSDRRLVTGAEATFGAVVGLDGAEVVRLSEEHGIVRGGAAASLAVGDRVVVIPNHICPVVNLFDEVQVIEADGTISASPIDARGLSR